MELAPGTTIDKYVVEELLGRGGMASVYRVRHASLRSAFALKVLDLPSRSIRERLQSEGMYQANLRHPNVVAVLDVLEVEGSPALILELVEGPSLDGLLRVHRPTVEQIDAIARGALDGVRAAHKVGLVHRDLKPANILLARTEDGFVPKIADFGLAKLIGGEAPASGPRTRTGATLGTPAYMAPEQFRASREVDERADVYALGVTLYELCTGRRPVSGEDLVEVWEAMKVGGYPRPRELAPELPERMEAAILGALVVDPDRRLRSVEALAGIWCSGAEALSANLATWDRGLLDSVTRSGAPSSLRSADPRPTWHSQASGAGSGETLSAPPLLPARGFGRRAAPFVAVMGLALSLLLVVPSVGSFRRDRSEAPSPAAAAPSADEDVRSRGPASAIPGRSEGGIGIEEGLLGRREPVGIGPKGVAGLGGASNAAPGGAPPEADLADRPVAPAEARWSMSGDPARVELRAPDGRVHPPGPLPAGTYRLWYGFGPVADRDGGEVAVSAGEELRVACSAGVCAREPAAR